MAEPPHHAHRAVARGRLDAQVRISELLADYPRLQPIAGPLASGVNSFVGTEVDKLLAQKEQDLMAV